MGSLLRIESLPCQWSDSDTGVYLVVGVASWVDTVATGLAALTMSSRGKVRWFTHGSQPLRKNEVLQNSPCYEERSLPVSWEDVEESLMDPSIELLVLANGATTFHLPSGVSQQVFADTINSRLCGKVLFGYHAIREKSLLNGIKYTKIGIDRRLA